MFSGLDSGLTGKFDYGHSFFFCDEIGSPSISQSSNHQSALINIISLIAIHNV